MEKRLRGRPRIDKKIQDRIRELSQEKEQFEIRKYPDPSDIQKEIIKEFKLKIGIQTINKYRRRNEFTI
jgi:predicted ATP-dependent protease